MSSLNRIPSEIRNYVTITVTGKAVTGEMHVFPGVILSEFCSSSPDERMLPIWQVPHSMRKNSGTETENYHDEQDFPSTARIKNELHGVSSRLFWKGAVPI
jgi:hypothetical protein